MFEKKYRILMPALLSALVLLLTAFKSVSNGTAPNETLSEPIKSADVSLANDGNLADGDPEPGSQQDEQVFSAMGMPYNWPMWDGSIYPSYVYIDNGYMQDPVSIAYYPDTMRAVNTKYATVVLKASGGLRSTYAHENNLSIAPYAFAWSTEPEPPEYGKITTYKGYSFKNIDWFLAGEIFEGEVTASDVLDVNEAISGLVSSVDSRNDGTPDSDVETAQKAYYETKRLELGKTYYFFAIRLGGNALFATSGFHPGDLSSNGEPTEPVNFVRSDIVTSVPLTMPAEATIFAVSFDSNGGTECAPRLIADGEKLPRPSDPTKAGHTFAGWYSASDFSTIFNFDTPVASDLTLYAKWIDTGIEIFTVRFNTIGGSAIELQLVENGQKVSKPADPTKAGYIFKGWYADSACTIPFNFAKPVTSPVTIYGWWDEGK
ncbi:MAG: InlB B-repeat-containing protein [Clostridiales bacterium]|jgi:uncharacterized repeat protein (TIGR02543 family)|nr:InlB B-repeat-containing protein [Clostridiales bacterium]